MALMLALELDSALVKVLGTLVQRGLALVTRCDAGFVGRVGKAVRLGCPPLREVGTLGRGPDEH
jgi:hypothetical protein